MNAPAPNGSNDERALSYEDALSELDALIGRLEAGSIALDDAIAAYERGAALARHCEALLEQTERRVSALMIGADGSLAEAPLPAENEPALPGMPAAPATSQARRPQARAVDPDDVPF